MRGKFGCISFETADREWIAKIQEKPDTVGSSNRIASIGLYNFPYTHFQRLAQYSAAVPESLDASKKEASPGAFLSWLVDQLKPAAGFQQHRVEGVKGYEIIGEWFDIGNPTDLKIAYFWYTNVVLGQLRTVEDLIVARATRRVDDKSYLVCRRVSVSPNSQAGIRTLRFFFETSDELCSLRKAGRGLKTVAEIKAGKDNALWERIESSLNSGDLPFNWVDSEAEIQAPDAHAPILLSGGVFLLDSDNAGLFKTRVLIPLL
ncbi:MAG: hypothetical protein JZU63_02470, partial [Rhodoferax sp.]|nr:hypothetical protein [Rhodoferax sp.]